MEIRKEADNGQYLLQNEQLSLEKTMETKDAKHKMFFKKIETGLVNV